MSRRPIARSADVTRLQNEGYDLESRNGYLLVRDVPYVCPDRSVRRGILISQLDLAGDVTVKPASHVAYWSGEHPCHSDGRKITAIENSSGPKQLCEGLTAEHTFSAKAAYRDYHHKVTTYIGRIAGEATLIDPLAEARTFPVIPAEGDGGPFKYEDTASSRAGIAALNRKIAGQRVGIVGIGGTGSYLLDLVAKTAVAEIRIIDGDRYSQHNAFRSPGAPSVDELRQHPSKAGHFRGIYQRMHTGIVIHDVYLTEDNLTLLDGLDFVFLCVDQGEVKRLAAARLTANGTPFIETGLGVLLDDNGQLGGIVRVTASMPETRERAAPHISYADDDGAANEYATNIQIAELNALNAALAVIKWKKLFGYYRDSAQAAYTGFSIAAGQIATDKPAADEQDSDEAACHASTGSNPNS